MVFLRPSFGAYAPPSPNSARNLYFLRRVRRLLMIILPSGILSRRSRATLPEGESFLSRHLRATLPEGESLFIPAFACHSPRRGKPFYPGICAPLSPKGKAFPQSGKTFYLFNSIKTNRKTFNNIK